MDREAFFALVDDRLGTVPGRARERVGDRCLADFSHPTTRDRVGDGVGAALRTDDGREPTGSERRAVGDGS